MKSKYRMPNRLSITTATIFLLILTLPFGAQSQAKSAQEWIKIGNHSYYLDADHALYAYQQALILDPNHLHARNQIGMLFTRLQRFEEAKNTFLTLLKYADTQKSWQAAAYSNLSILARKQNNLVEAEKWHLKSLTIEIELGRKEGIAMDYSKLGNLAQMRGNLGRAKGFYQKALEITEEIGDQKKSASIYANLGLIVMKQENHDTKAACALWEKSIALYQILDITPMVGQVESWMQENCTVTNSWLPSTDEIKNAPFFKRLVDKITP